MTDAVVTRFAPSPTGFLHIGGARTALFNWLFARGRGGKFLLRIEDTDRARHTQEAVDAILEGLSWLGIEWDGEPVSQYERRMRHVEVAEALVASGNAYRCYLTPVELETAREKAKAECVRFQSPYRPRDGATPPPPGDGAPYAVRFWAPEDGATVVEDAVQGSVSFPNTALDDLIILRSNGEATYNLAVVADDHDMDVTHVIRGDDHLTNAARQQQIYNALGWVAPVFAHVPLIHGADGAKLSKRHGALGVEAYRDDGYLPEGLANYLLRLGWSHGDEEIIPAEKAKEWFDVSGVNKAPARLDFDKLKHINGHYIAALADGVFVDKAVPFLARGGVSLGDEMHARLLRAAPALKTRCATLADVAGAAEFLCLSRPLELTGKAAKPLKKDNALEMVAAVSGELSDETLWASPESLENALKGLAERLDVGFGAIGAPTRAALTAGRPSPSLAEVLYALGPAEALARLDDVIM
ncbi:MAG: glutamate--tRNA ligase [Pseudomonadota bacterium]